MITRLYKPSRTVCRQWSCDVNDCHVEIQHGIIHGELQTETFDFDNPSEAKEFARSRINKKILREGYSEDPDASPPGLPMLCHNFRAHGHKLPNKVEYQPKLDGYRCVGSREVMMSRKREPFTSLPHIQQALTKLPPGIRVDGELYVHGMSLQELGGYVRSHEPKEGYEQIEYHVFDIQDTEERYSVRRKRLEELYRDYLQGPIKLVESLPGRRRDADRIRDEFRSDGYEGCIIRNTYHNYEFDTRSYGVQKHKSVLTCWFNLKKIVAAKQGREKGLSIAVCERLTGQEFRARLAMDSYIRKWIYDNRDKMLPGAALIEFSDFTEEGRPSHPRCLEVVQGKKVAKEEISEV